MLGESLMKAMVLNYQDDEVENAGELENEESAETEGPSRLSMNKKESQKSLLTQGPLPEMKEQEIEDS